MSPLTTWLSEAPRLVAVPMAPLVRLNRPVENLNGDQRDGIRGQCVQHAANRQHAEPDHEDPLPAVDVSLSGIVRTTAMVTIESATTR